MITLTAVLLGSSPAHALSLAQSIKASCNGELTALVDDVRVYCSLQCGEPDTEGKDEKDAMFARILEEIKIRDSFEQKLTSLGCPYTFRYAEAIDALLPYVKKTIFSKES